MSTKYLYIAVKVSRFAHRLGNEPSLLHLYGEILTLDIANACGKLYTACNVWNSLPDQQTSIQQENLFILKN